MRATRRLGCYLHWLCEGCRPDFPESLAREYLKKRCAWCCHTWGAIASNSPGRFVAEKARTDLQTFSPSGAAPVYGRPGLGSWLSVRAGRNRVRNPMGCKRILVYERVCAMLRLPDGLNSQSANIFAECLEWATYCKTRAQVRKRRRALCCRKAAVVWHAECEGMRER